MYRDGDFSPCTSPIPGPKTLPHETVVHTPAEHGWKPVILIQSLHCFFSNTSNPDFVLYTLLAEGCDNNCTKIEQGSFVVKKSLNYSIVRNALFTYY